MNWGVLSETLVGCVRLQFVQGVRSDKKIERLKALLKKNKIAMF